MLIIWYIFRGISENKRSDANKKIWKILARVWVANPGVSFSLSFKLSFYLNYERIAGLDFGPSIIIIFLVEETGPS